MKHLKQFNEEIGDQYNDLYEGRKKSEEMEKSMGLLKDFALFVTQMENDRSSPEIQEELAQELLNRFLETKR
jgi:hypothetical protein